MEDTILLHFGTKRHSGRYPWGSGKGKRLLERARKNGDGNQGHVDLYKHVSALKKSGMSEKMVADKMKMSLRELRAAVSLGKAEEDKQIEFSIMKSISKNPNIMDKEVINAVKSLGLEVSNAKINRLLNKNPIRKDMNDIQKILVDRLKEVDMVDVGAGTPEKLGISKERMKSVLAGLGDDYNVHKVYVKNEVGDGYVEHLVLTKKDLEYARKNRNLIEPVDNFRNTDGDLVKLKAPKSVPWEKVHINYGDKGGSDADGLIEIGPGGSMDLGKSKYAQVRIAVGGTHYLKGMAIMNPEIPPGEIRFNTNKPSGTAREKVLKPFEELKGEHANPLHVFKGEIVKQNKSAEVNIIRSEGEWETWKHDFASQFLSKQPLPYVNKMIKKSYEANLEELTSIKEIKNNSLKSIVLDNYIRRVERQAKDLNMVGDTTTSAHVLLPNKKMKPGEIYAEGYDNGDKVALVRYPHAGTFEIPVLTVNNNAGGRGINKYVKGATDFCTVHPSVAEKLSGADFDGDVVYITKNNKGEIKSTRSLQALSNFDPKMYYQEGHVTTKHTEGLEMGKVSNLINNMTVKGASQGEIARAVKHSMVAIDSKKHELSWEMSRQENGITALEKKYSTPHTLLVTAKHIPTHAEMVAYRKYLMRPKTIEVMDAIVKQKIEASKKVVDAERMNKFREEAQTAVLTKEFKKDSTSIKLALKKGTNIDRYGTGSPVEKSYAEFIRSTRILAKTAESLKRPYKKDPMAASEYKDQINSIQKKLSIVMQNLPLERKAQRLAERAMWDMDTSGMNKMEYGKAKEKAISYARNQVGAKRGFLELTDREWEAVNNNALTKNLLENISRYMTTEHVKKGTQKAKRRETIASTASRIAILHGKGYTAAMIAKYLGISVKEVRQVIGNVR